MDRHRVLIVSSMASLLLLVAFLILQSRAGAILDMPSRYLWVSLVPVIIGLFAGGYITKLESPFIKLSKEIKPTEAVRPPANEQAESVQLEAIKSREPLPVDYFFINHTSFLRAKKQAEFQARTGVKAPHYDIQVIVDSYYRGAMERIEHVKYVLHRAYPEPIQIRTQAANKFLLKELANGEYVLVAEVFLKDQKEPLILQRYINLLEDGPPFDAPKRA